jgi:hypothetical protein
MDKKRKMILIVAVVGMIGTFLPWFSAFGYSVSGTEGDGWITLFLFAVGGALAFFAGDKAEPLGKGKLMGVWIPAAIAAFIALRNIFRSRPGGVDLGIGLWFIAIAGVVQVVHILFLKGASAGAAPVEPAPPAPKPAPEPQPEPEPVPEPEPAPKPDATEEPEE